MCYQTITASFFNGTRATEYPLAVDIIAEDVAKMPVSHSEKEYLYETMIECFFETFNENELAKIHRDYIRLEWTTGNADTIFHSLSLDMKGV